MEECKVKLREWGSSLGVIIPREIVKKESLKKNEIIDILIVKRDNTLRNLFGSGKKTFKKSSQELKDELRKELYDDV